jgi:acetyl esterase/lipase
LGQLNAPKPPDIEGLESFAGPAFHSARWDHSVLLGGRRVGVIGCAASAVQLIPEVAKTAGHLTVFQRTPNWLLPRLDREITEEDTALLMTAPHVFQLTRDQLYQNADYLFWQAFSWTPEGRAAFTRQSTMHLEAQVPDPELRRKLTPDYPIGCKRVLFADDYYPALLRPNVALETGAIERITPEGVRMRDGIEHPLDVLVYATGFETTGWDWPLQVKGRAGCLRDVWGDGPEAYLGITVAGFPNLFMIYGPNTNLGHNSITFMIERQSEYIAQALTEMQRRGLRAIEPSVEAQTRFNRDIQDALSRTTWADRRCNSWYKNAAGRITQNWPSHTRDYAAAVKTVNFDDYVCRKNILSDKLDPNVRLLLEAIAAQGDPPLDTLSPAEARRSAAESLGPVGGVPEPVRSIENLSIPGPGGLIPIRIYTPDAPAPRPAMVYFHGGGWVVCDLDTHDVVCSAIAHRAGAVVVSVDYRLAPEHKFPAAVVDSYAATLWVAANAERLGIDPARIAVGGDSAGGNLGAVVSLKSRDEKGPPIALQALVYPVTDLSSFDTASYAEFADGYQLTKTEMEWFRDHYLRSMDDARDPHASPLLARDLSRMPPALIITAECDPLRDEGEAYGKRLTEAGVPVTCTRYTGMIHPFFSLSGAIPQAFDAIRQVADAVKSAGRGSSTAGAI